ncbi:ankyrin [Microthyrium microscopicum]|uniref:Ankyrin n=1 Tax=Microthyrium microscopicum TaxID=703497 RepID=A0A6A6UJK2_9PEZI|nr:ankyrin [Microthyrium microscopicum]
MDGNDEVALMALTLLRWAFLIIPLASALPIPPRIAADSLSVFTDPNSHYPRVHDALHSLCRNVAELHRTYEMDLIYRTSELRQKVVGDRLDAVCGELPRIIRKPDPHPPGPGAIKVLSSFPETMCKPLQRTSSESNHVIQNCRSSKTFPCALLDEEQRDLEEYDHELGTPLHAAIRKNKFKAFEYLLSKGADTESHAPGPDGQGGFTALMLTAIMGRRRMMKVLWDRNPGQVLSSPESYKMTVFGVACSYSNGEMVQDLLSWSNSWGESQMDQALHRAASRWKDDIIKVLLQARSYDQKHLGWALLRVLEKKLVLWYGEEVTYEPEDRAHQVESIQLLLNAGANPNGFVDSQSQMIRPLHVASRYKESVDGLRILLQNGADVNASTSEDVTGLIIAATKPPLRRGNSPANIEGARVLLEFGANVDVVYGDKTLLQILKSDGFTELFNLCYSKSRLNPTNSETLDQTI